MKQTIILANNLNGTEYLKTLANLANQSKNTFGVRVFNSLELAKYALQLTGVVVDKQFVSDSALAAQLYVGVKQIEYFKDSSYEDVYNLLKSVNELRRCIPFDEQSEIESKLPLDLFQKKNEAVKEFYQLLVNTLDALEIIDEISLIRLAIEHAKVIKDTEFIRYEELMYTNLDIALLDSVAGKEVSPSRLSDDKKLNISSYTKAFGQNNEIEAILSYIYKNNIKFDECIIAASDVNAYGKILSNYQSTIGFPLIIGNSQSINDTSAGRLFSMFLSWENSHFHKDFLIKILNSREFNLDLLKQDIELPESFDVKNIELGLSFRERISFDLIVDTIGNLRIGFQLPSGGVDNFTEYERLIHQRKFAHPDDPIVRRDLLVYEYVTKIKDVFDHDLQYLIVKYTKLDESNLPVERNALTKIALCLTYQYLGVPLNDLIKFLAKVSVGSRNPQPGHLYITSISNAISSLRKHLFVVGLDSKSFPGKVKEDPIIFDRDYECFGVSNASTRDIEKNKNDYHALIETAKSLGVDIHLSYAYYNSQTIKEQSASSVVFETYQKENVGRVVTVMDFNKEFNNHGNDKFRSVEFFDESLFPLSKIGETLKTNVMVTPKEIQDSDTSNVSAMSLLSSRGLSFSSINQFVECEYKFFLGTLLHIDQEKEPNIYEIIPANDFGTLIHSLMEQYDSSISNDEFLKLAREIFNEYIILHPTEDKQGMNKALQEFLDCASHGFDLEKSHNSPSVLKEEDVICLHQPSGLLIHGFPDKVELLNDGTYRVVDYKTGEKFKHDVNNPDSVLQGAHYAYILEHDYKLKAKLHDKHIKVSEFVFRYLKSKEEVSSYDSNHNIQEYLNRLDEILISLSEALKTGKFNKTGDCKSCFFKDVCGGKEDE